MRLIAVFVFLSCNCFGSKVEPWFDRVKSRVDQSAIDWLREEIMKDFSKIDLSDLSAFTQSPCKHCSYSGGLFDMDPKIYVFMSFSVPEETWLNLSSQLEHYSGVFVIRGLPKNSFSELANKLALLKKKGMNTAVLIDPKLFSQFQIKHSPTFVFFDGKQSHKIAGNISLEYALDCMSNEKDEAFQRFMETQ